jgi:hypothetical protein
VVPGVGDDSDQFPLQLRQLGAIHVIHRTGEGLRPAFVRVPAMGTGATG